MVGFVLTFALPFEGLYELDIIHYNDFHARFEETSIETPTCRANNNSCLGGFPRLYKMIESLRQKKPNSILLNAGDSFQGTYWYTLLKWNITQEFMNLLEHDAHAIGNHEFDDGPQGLAPYLRALKAPVVAANMDTSDEPLLQGLYKPYIIIERKKRKIGIIGIITQETKMLSSPGNVEFTDPLEAVKREAKKLNDQGVDIIIVLSHCGLDVDKKIAHDVGEYVDIIVGGHSHSLLWNGPAPSGEEVAGPYPVFIQSSASKKHKVVIVQASGFTKYMGNMKVYFNNRGDYVKWDGGPIFLDRNEPEDLEIKARLAPYAEMVYRVVQEVIGESTITLHFEDCVLGECALGNLLVDSMAEFEFPWELQKLIPRGRSRGHQLVSYTIEKNFPGKLGVFEGMLSGFGLGLKMIMLLKRAQTLRPDLHYMSLIQRGNIKSTIPIGLITKGVIFELLRFNDRVMVFELQGKDILLALERSVSAAWALDPFKGPNVLQVSGLQVTYNVSLPEGQRVTSAYVGNSRDSNVPLDPSVYYNVIAPAYLADGGDGFTMLKEGKRNVEVVARDQRILEMYIEKHSPINVSKDGRIAINY